MDKQLIAKILQALICEDEGQQKKLLDELSGSEQTEWERFLKFTDKEISKMPQNYRKLFRTDGLRAHVRKRKRGNSITYEVRCRMCGVNITAGGTTVEEAKKRFLEKLHEPQKTATNVPSTFEGFTEYYFKKYREKKVTAKTYKNDVNRLKTHVIPAIGKKQIRDITPTDIENILEKLSDKKKTAEEIYSLLNGIFRYAIAHRIISISPMQIIDKPTHERISGKALSIQEEAMLFKRLPQELHEQFAIALYCGLRPCEYSSVRKKGDIIIAENAKRKNGKIEYKRIPISPMLKPYLKENGTIQNYKAMWKTFKNLFPEHRLYDLRTTFCSRCIECQIDPIAVKLMMGHSLGKLGNAYVDVSDSFLKKEMAKFEYDLPPILPPNLPPN